MIEFIHIRGYQSHVDTRIELSKGMTAITGLSMDGKTALLRGFKWAKDNRPTGSKFRYKYDDIDTKVDIGVDGHVISHIKSSKSLNKEGHKALYSILYPDGETKEFSAYGTSVPEEISELLNISDICIQNQLDPYMLILSTSGQIASTINKITGIDASDGWIKEIKKAIRSLDAEATVISKNKKTLVKELSPFEGIDEVKSSVVKATQLQDEYDKIVYDANHILDLIEIINASKVKLKAEKATLSRLKSLLATDTQMAQELARITTLNASAARYNNALIRRTDLYANINRLKPLMDSLAAMDADLFKIKQINSLVSNVESCKSWRDLKLSDRYTAKDEYINALISMGKCSVCGNELNDYKALENQI